jgi:hypothetical protein
VNTALIVGQPLLVTGEPGTARRRWRGRSRASLDSATCDRTCAATIARPTRYEVDNLRRFYDAQVQDPRAKQPEL